MARYTADEMRDMATEAEVIEVADQFYGHDMDTIAAMLRQSADDMEREEKRERKYQYGVVFGGDGIDSDNIFDSEEYARTVAGDYLQVVRREVGEWEEFE